MRRMVFGVELFGAVWLFGVVVLGDEAAMATAPQVPAAATATVADTARSIRLDLSNRSPFSGVLDASNRDHADLRKALRAS